MLGEITFVGAGVPFAILPSCAAVLAVLGVVALADAGVPFAVLPSCAFVLVARAIVFADTGVRFVILRS